MSDTIEVSPVKAGDAVAIRTEDYRDTVGLVTCVHGEFGAYVPCINVVYVSDDAAKRDPYGHQLERMSSLQHESQVNMSGTPGRYWKNV